MQCRLFYCIMENEQRGMITFILAVCGNVDYVYSFPLSPPSRAAWIEMPSVKSAVPVILSPPSRAAWIEISGRIDTINSFLSPPSRAAWIEISYPIKVNFVGASPPSRAAWIEMLNADSNENPSKVAAFTGGVD